MEKNFTDNLNLVVSFDVQNNRGESLLPHNQHNTIVTKLDKARVTDADFDRLMLALHNMVKERYANAAADSINGLLPVISAPAQWGLGDNENDKLHSAWFASRWLHNPMSALRTAQEPRAKDGDKP